MDGCGTGPVPDACGHGCTGRCELWPRGHLRSSAQPRPALQAACGQAATCLRSTTDAHPCVNSTPLRPLPHPAQLPGELDPQNTTLFVGGLSAHVSEDALRGVFGRYGEISYVKIPPGKGCGFVHFADRQVRGRGRVHGWVGGRVGGWWVGGWVGGVAFKRGWGGGPGI